MRKRLGGWVLGFAGWRIEGELPARGRYVIIGAPHTSNWDFVLGLTAAAAFGLKISWLGKDTVFRWPFGGVMRRMGGIPIHRDRTEGVVEQVVEALKAADTMILAIAPEGTRSPMPCWKSGFYHIARTAGVPIFPVYIDGAERCFGAGPAIHLTGDVGRDMGEIRGFFAGRLGIRPGNAGPVKLREET